MNVNEAYEAIDAGITELLNARDLIRQLPTIDNRIGDEGRAAIRKDIAADISGALTRIRKVKIEDIEGAAAE